MLIRRIIPIVLLLIALSSCEKEPKKLPQKAIKVSVPKFNPDSAFSFIEQQISFGPRPINSEGHADCKNWIVQKLKAYKFEVIEQPFEATSFKGEKLKGANIIGRFNSDIKERVLLCAHWDTRPMAEKDTINRDAPILDADDGGSGVGVLLEIARQINNKPIPMGLDIVFFDAEDYGSNEENQDYTWGLGSQYWSKNMHEKDYQVKYGILLDMVGSKGATFPKEGFSMRSAANVVEKIWKLAGQIGKGKYFENRRIPPITDDHRFIIENTKIPMVDIINVSKEGKFGFYHHTHSDNLEIIDKQTLNAVGQVVLAVIYNESNKDF